MLFWRCLAIFRCPLSNQPASFILFYKHVYTVVYKSQYKWGYWAKDGKMPSSRNDQNVELDAGEFFPLQIVPTFFEKQATSFGKQDKLCSLLKVGMDGNCQTPPIFSPKRYLLRC